MFIIICMVVTSIEQRWFAGLPDLRQVICTACKWLLAEKLMLVKLLPARLTAAMTTWRIVLLFLQVSYGGVVLLLSLLFDLLLEFEVGGHAMVEAGVLRWGPALAGLAVFVNTLAESASFVTKFQNNWWLIDGRLVLNRLGLCGGS